MKSISCLPLADRSSPRCLLKKKKKMRQVLPEMGSGECSEAAEVGVHNAENGYLFGAQPLAPGKTVCERQKRSTITPFPVGPR